jgi:hypothetical protein
MPGGNRTSSAAIQVARGGGAIMLRSCGKMTFEFFRYRKLALESAPRECSRIMAHGHLVEKVVHI